MRQIVFTILFFFAAVVTVSAQDIQLMGEYNNAQIEMLKHLNAGDLEKARPYAEKTLALAEKLYGKDSKEYLSSLVTLGSIYDMTGDSEKAVQIFSEAVKITQKQGDKEAYLKRLDDLGNALRRAGRAEKAVKVYRQLLNETVRIHGGESSSTAKALNQLAMAEMDAGQFLDAEKSLKEAIGILHRAYGPGSPDEIPALLNLGYLYYKARQYPLAKKHYLTALKLIEKHYGSDTQLAKACRANLAKVEREIGR